MFRIGLGCLICLLTSCQYQRGVEASFYYWKTVYRQDSVENNALKSIAAKRLFVRIMDVDLDETGTMAIPISSIAFKTPLPNTIEAVPVIYLVNEVLKQQSEQQLKILASKILSYTEAKVRQGGKENFRELQLDCDWTSSTRNRYFYFLQELKKHTDQKGITLSATLRLHQVKNIHNSGVPPVDKVLLMCYNMGNLRQYGPQNSILDLKEMEIYLKDVLKTYPLTIDVALPLFSWSVIFRDKQYIGISKRLEPYLLADTSLFEQQASSPLYVLKKSLPKAGLRANDVVRREEVNVPDLLAASDFLSRYLPRENFKLIFYHLDAPLLNNFRDEDLQEIINRF